jgi:phosphohistidine phosphatase
MAIFLCQHGEAYNEEENPVRPLTPNGIEKVKRIAKNAFLNKKPPDVIYHSTKLRAKETANIIAGVIDFKGIVTEIEGINPKDDPKKFFNSMNINSDALIVSHLPFLNRFLSLLTTGRTEYEIIKFQKGGIVSLEKENQYWQIINAYF